MAKVGVSLKIDVTKIDKARMYNGEKGTYLDAVVFIDIDEKDQYGNSGMIKQDWKDAPKGETPILGNARVFWKDEATPEPQLQQPKQQAQSKAMAEPDFDFDDDIPF